MEPEVHFFLSCAFAARIVPTLCTLVVHLRRQEHTGLEPFWIFAGLLWTISFFWYAHVAFYLENLRLAGRILVGFGITLDAVFFFREKIESCWASIDRDDEDLLPLCSPPVPPSPWTRQPRWARSPFRLSPPPYSELPEMGEPVIELSTIEPAVLTPQRDQSDPTTISSSRR